VTIRGARPEDWQQIWPFWHRIVAAGETYVWARDTTQDRARALWMAQPEVYVVEEGGAIVASAYTRPNYGPGASGDVGNAAFMVDPDHAGHGYGRRLAEDVLEKAGEHYRAMVFNAVVETNPAVRLWLSLGFVIVGTIPKAFAHPTHGPVGLHVLHRDL
jgi:GNAT superfamily N-acetyltransferase